MDDAIALGRWEAFLDGAVRGAFLDPVPVEGRCEFAVLSLEFDIGSPCAGADAGP